MGDKKISVLLVDDEVDFTQSMAFWLQSKGYSVTVANDGQNALKIVKESSPDIVFLDLLMPVMDGIETLKKIREFNKEIPVIIISAYVDDIKTKETITYGISGIFYKGSDFNKGLTLLETALRTHTKLKK
jgi:CheY-like chemotaxis protein